MHHESAPRRVPRVLAGWPPGFRRLAVYAFFSSLAIVGFDSFISPFLRESGISVVSIGVFHALTAAAAAIGAPVAGILADRWGRRTVLFVGRALRVLSWVLILALPRTAWLVPIASVWGLGMASATAFTALTGETAPRGRRAMAFAVTGAIDSLTSMLVPVTLGMIADRVTLGTALALALLPGVVSLILVWRLEETLAVADRAAPATPATGAPRPGTPAHRASLAGLAYVASPAGRGAALMAAVWTITGLEIGLMRPVTALYITDRFGVSYAGLGAVSTVAAAGMVLGWLAGGHTADRIGYARLMTICLASTAAMYAIVPVATTPAVYALLMTAANFCACLAAPCWGAVGAASTPRVVRGSVTGLFTSMQAAGVAVGGAVSGYVYAAAITLPFYLFALSDLTMLLLVLIGVRARWSGFSRSAMHED